MKYNKITLLIASVCLHSQFANAEQTQQSNVEHIQILGVHDKLRTQGGATSLIGEEALAQFEFDDINKVLANVPGVNIREEDGYGLRPNIGFRGTTPERSKKISLMEDGILISPAPYSAPSAYYFPMVSRMTAVEIFKGPAAIKYGPNTVAGALNLVTRAVPKYAETGIDLAYGSDNYSKAHLHHGNSGDKFGYLIEGLHTQADGFKNIDFSKQDTGFEKNDIMTKLKYDFSQDNQAHYLELKLAYADETSNETYLGLTDQDFADSPYRRYAATSEDQMNWDHQTYQLTHFIELAEFNLLTRLYQHDFARDWRKVSALGQNSPALLDVLTAPDDPENQEYYARLNGSDSGDIILGTNDRNYRSQGLQTDLGWQFVLSGLQHNVDLGLRLHKDYINRDHFEQTYQMSSQGQLGQASEKTFTTVNREEATAVSIYAQDAIQIEQLTLTAGIRGEYIDSRYQNRKNDNDWLEKESRIWLPSLSAFYRLSADYGVFAGVHKGYVPSSPQQNDQSVEAEQSINYEIGFRQNSQSLKTEFALFYNDYSNLKESCTFSQSSNCPLDTDFNGGNVNVAGLESQIASVLPINSSIDMPWSFTYSYIHSEFEQSFDSDYPQWGLVSKGDSMPYQPDHSLALSLGLRATDWQLSAQIKYTSEMQETAGAGAVLSGKVIPSTTMVDLSANYLLTNEQSIYLKVDNVTDETQIVSRRPNGARPGKPRTLILGYKFNY